VPGNPLAAKGFDPAIWSYGHRNPLGLAFDAEGRLWEDEMGPKGGDEVNLILPGRNYGWPLVSNGDNYDGSPIPRHATRPGLEAPRLSWNPSISPSSLLIYSGTLFPGWHGKALIGALSGEMLILVELGGASVREEARYDMGRRIRAVDAGPDGAVYLLEDGPDGRLLRLTPDR
jgi:glucose/arabinose dehydrogenase